MCIRGHCSLYYNHQALHSLKNPAGKLKVKLNKCVHPLLECSGQWLIEQLHISGTLCHGGLLVVD